MSIERRRFLELGTSALAAAGLSGCAALIVTHVIPEAGTVRLRLRDFPQLGRPGGFVRIQPQGAATPLYVLTLDDGEHVVLSPVCTHLGCLVNVEGSRLACPCHGSLFDRTGRVVRGPAEQPLQRFSAAVSPQGELLIRLEGTG